MTAWALAARDIEVYVIHASTAISTVTGEDAKRPNREPRRRARPDHQPHENNVDAARASADSIPSGRRPPNALKACERPSASRSRPTHWLSCLTIWSANGSSVLKSSRSRMLLERLERASNDRPHAMVPVRVGEGWHRDGGRVGTGGAAAKLARSPRCCALCRPHRPARREQKHVGDKRAGAFRQFSDWPITNRTLSAYSDYMLEASPEFSGRAIAAATDASLP